MGLLCNPQVLLENYSNLNYTGLIKILKKHDKRTGLLLRHPFITTVLRQVGGTAPDATLTRCGVSTEHNNTEQHTPVLLCANARLLQL